MKNRLLPLPEEERESLYKLESPLRGGTPNSEVLEEYIPILIGAADERTPKSSEVVQSNIRNLFEPLFRTKKFLDFLKKVDGYYANKDLNIIVVFKDKSKKKIKGVAIQEILENQVNIKKEDAGYYLYLSHLSIPEIYTNVSIAMALNKA